MSLRFFNLLERFSSHLRVLSSVSLSFSVSRLRRENVVLNVHAPVVSEDAASTDHRYCMVFLDNSPINRGFCLLQFHSIKCKKLTQGLASLSNVRSVSLNTGKVVELVSQSRNILRIVLLYPGLICIKISAGCQSPRSNNYREDKPHIRCIKI